MQNNSKRIILKDINGDVLEDNEQIFLTEDGLIKLKDIKDYTGLVFGFMTLLDYESVLLSASESYYKEKLEGVESSERIKQ